MKRIYQCPGCWATAIYPNPAVGDFECDFCHERLTCIDLRARADPIEPDWRMPESPGEADALAGALSATGDELGQWVKKAEIYRQGLAEAVVRANTAEMHRDRAWQNLDTAHEDIAAMLRASGLGDYARPISTHDVIQRELLPWIEVRAAGPDDVPHTTPRVYRLSGDGK